MRVVLLLTAFVASGFLGESAAATNLEPPPQRVLEWGLASRAGGVPTDPSGLAVDSTGSVYVVELGANRIQKFSSSGRLIDRWGVSPPDPDAFMNPFGIAVGPDDSVYVTEVGRDAVRRLDSRGRELDRWGSTGDGPGEFRDPLGIAVDRAGNVYVVDGEVPGNLGGTRQR